MAALTKKDVIVQPEDIVSGLKGLALSPSLNEKGKELALKLETYLDPHSLSFP